MGKRNRVKGNKIKGILRPRKNSYLAKTTCPQVIYRLMAEDILNKWQNDSNEQRD